MEETEVILKTEVYNGQVGPGKGADDRFLKDPWEEEEEGLPLNKTLNIQLDKQMVIWSVQVIFSLSLKERGRHIEPYWGIKGKEEDSLS